MTCRDVADFIELIAAEEIQPTAEIRAHLETRPSCAAAPAARPAAGGDPCVDRTSARARSVCGERAAARAS
jgi:hypothetical protein